MKSVLKGRPVFPFRRGISLFMLLTVLGFTAFLCAFPVMDRDFWWHVKAGEIMFRMHSLISIEPFAYTRAGLPYIARHEWLAQIVLYLVFHLFGPTGVILFRTGMVALVFTLLLSIDPACFWPNGFLAIWALGLNRHGYTDRPQLFTYVLFSASLLLACRALEWSADGSLSPFRRKWIAFGFIVIQILWTNFHGGACVMGFLIVGSLWIQAVASRRDVKFFSALAAGIFVASFVSPNTYHNAVYLIDLIRDRSTLDLLEWQPSPWVVYRHALGPLWILALFCWGTGRRGRIFSLLLLAATGVLSRKAVRNEELFVFAAFSVIVFSLRHNPAYQRFLGWVSSRKVLVMASTGLLLWGLASYAHALSVSFLRGDQIYREGYGVFEPARGAYDFIERENIRGPMFNTYEVGAYLIYRGYPNRPVFVDGRNLDYGYEIISEEIQAGFRPVVWEELERRYQLAYAVIEYAKDDLHKPVHLVYAEYLNANPHWKLVYLDDWVAVYLKDVPGNLTVIRRDQYRLLTPRSLDDPKWVMTLRPEQGPLLEAELHRVIAGCPNGVTGRLTLARYFVRRGEWEKGRPLAEEALRREPLRPSIYEVLEMIEEGEGRWKQAAGWYEQEWRLVNPSYDATNEMRAAHVFAQAGNSAVARKHWFRAQKEWDQTLRDHPGNPIVLNNLGVLFQQEGDNKSAIGYFKQAVARDPSYAVAYRNLGSVFYEAGRYAEAWECVLAMQKLGQNPEPLASAIRARVRSFPARSRTKT